MFDDKWIPLAAGALFSLIGAWLNGRAMLRKSRDDAAADERKAQREQETGERKELEASRAALRAEMREQLNWYEEQLKAARTENEQLAAEKNRLLILVDHAKREANKSTEVLEAASAHLPEGA